MAELELSVATTREAVDWIANLLATNGFDGPLAVVELPEAADDRWGLEVRFRVPADAVGHALAVKVDEALDTLRRVGLAGDLEVDDDPAPEAAAIAPRRVGERLVLLASGAQADRADDLPIHLPPSLAFGSGFHPATIACLRQLERLVRPGDRALDLGTGTGVLAVALARMGATVLALDNDPIAIAAAEETARVNGLADQIAVGRGSLGKGGSLGHWMGWEPLPEVPGHVEPAGFDLIAANILARVHVALAADYRATLRPGGRLVVGGFTYDQEDVVQEALRDAGFRWIDREQEGDYLVLAFVAR